MISDKVWVTGAKGFIGRALCASLAARGSAVFGIGHGAWSRADVLAGGLKLWLNSTVTFDGLQTLSDRSGIPDTVYHLAGGSSVRAAVDAPEEDYQRTVASTTALLNWLRLRAPTARVVLASSAAVYGDALTDRISETNNPNPLSNYGRHKLAMERLGLAHGRDHGMPVAIGRLFSVYGIGLRKQLLWDLSCRLNLSPNELELGGAGVELRDWTSVLDICDALPLLASAASTDCPVFNVGTGIGTSVKAIAELALGAWPSKAKVMFNGSSRSGDPFSLVADVSRLAQLGMRCERPVAEGVEEYVRWSRDALGCHR